ncbi:MAG TPA: alpha/beta hydrolase-fold protein [Mucilaginibacter sp.]|nr:alpha/beta hydrolase-fold protein [Mucilaginibacter sp.]
MNTFSVHSLARKCFAAALFIFTLTNQVMAQLPKVACGSIQRLEKFPSKFVDPRNVDIWLPEGYSPNKKYAVLYMHDGQALFDSTLMWNHQEWGVDETMCRLLAAKKIQDCIVVGIWNNGLKRFPEYFPQKAFCSLTPAQQEKILDIGRDKGTPLMGNGPVSDNYLKFIIQELKPYIDSHYSTFTDQQHTFTAGSSMGGLISMYAICEYPQVFGGAACLSTHWPGTFETSGNPVPAAFLQYLKTHLPSPKDHKIYFDHGTKTLDAQYKPFQDQADAIMKAAGYTEKNWISRVYPGADHSENSWRKRLDVPLLFLLSVHN